MTVLEPLSPVMALVLACIRADRAWDERAGQILAGSVDWDAVQSTAAAHGVLPLFYRRLSQHWADRIPAEVLALGKSIYQESAVRSLRQSRRLVQFVDLLEKQGVPCLCMKGRTLGAQAYGDPALRYSLDIDLLVQKDDFPRACRALTGAGLQAGIALEHLTAAQLRRINKHVGFHAQSDALELHGEVLESGMAYPVPPAYFWQEPAQVIILDQPLPVFGAPANLLMLCMQAAGDGWDHLRWVADVAHLCQACPPADWPAFLDDARRFGMARLVSLALLLAADLGGAPMPAQVLARCRSDQAAQALAREVTTRLLGSHAPVNGLRFYLRARERPRDRLFFVLDQVFVPKQVDWLTFRLPGWLSPAYYLLRPLRLVVKFSLAGARGLFHSLFARG